MDPQRKTANIEKHQALEEGEENMLANESYLFK